MNAKENIYEVRFRKIHIVSHILYHIVPLTIIIVLAIKAVGFQRSDKLQVPNLQCIMVISKIKKFFSWIFLLFQTKGFRISRFKY